MERLQGIALGISDRLATIIDGLMCFPTPEEDSVVWHVGLGAAPIGVVFFFRGKGVVTLHLFLRQMLSPLSSMVAKL